MVEKKYVNNKEYKEKSRLIKSPRPVQGRLNNRPKPSTNLKWYLYDTTILGKSLLRIQNVVFLNFSQLFNTKDGSLNEKRLTQ